MPQTTPPPLPVLRGVFFITGTDTEVGKTWVSCRLLERAREAGLKCYGLKPVAAGCDVEGGGGRPGARGGGSIEYDPEDGFVILVPSVV